MLLIYVLVVAAVVSASPNSYVPGRLPFVSNIHTKVETRWEPTDYYLTIGIDICPEISTGDVAVLINGTFNTKPDSIFDHSRWLCFNLVTGSISSRSGKTAIETVHATHCNYRLLIPEFERTSLVFKDVFPEIGSYMSHFRQRWFKNFKGRVCDTKASPHIHPGQLTPMKFTAVAFGDKTTEFAARLVGEDGKELASDRFALQHSHVSTQYISFSTKVAKTSDLIGTQATLQYGIVPRGKPLSKAFHLYSSPFYFARPDVYKFENPQFIPGRKGKIIVHYHFDFEHELMAHIVETSQILLFVGESESSEKYTLVVPKGKGSFEMVTGGLADKFTNPGGRSFTIRISDTRSSEYSRLDRPLYPAVHIRVNMEEGSAILAESRPSET